MKILPFIFLIIMWFLIGFFAGYKWRSIWVQICINAAKKHDSLYDQKLYDIIQKAVQKKGWKLKGFEGELKIPDDVQKVSVVQNPGFVDFYVKTDETVYHFTNKSENVEEVK